MPTEQGKLRSFGDSYIGSRRNNEDALGKREPQDSVLREERGCLYVVSDGMGGHAAGEVASHMAVKVVLEEYYADRRGVEISMESAIRVASQRIYEAAGDSIETEGMGCTVAVCAVFPERVCIAWVGDSRVYLRHKGQVQLQTTDHTIVEDRHHLSRAVGVQPDVEVPEPLRCQWEPGDRLLLCTDGLSNTLSEAEIAACLAEPTPRAAVVELLRLAAEHKANDNCTAVIVDYPLVAAPEDHDSQSDGNPTLSEPCAEKPGDVAIPETVSPESATNERPSSESLASGRSDSSRGSGVLRRLMGWRSNPPRTRG